MALKKLLSDLSTGIKAYPNHNTPSTSGGFNYGNSYTRIFDGGGFRQKSYEFGKGRTSDRPGGEFSKEPYLYSGLLSADQLPDIPNPGDESFFGKLGDGVDSATDGLIRGGLITAIKRSAQDALRIGKWAFDWPKGPMWLLTQTGLQRTNPKTEEKSALELDMDLGFLGDLNVDLGGNSRIYMPLGLNTIAQSLVNFGGLHINRAGLLPTSYGIKQGYGVDSTEESKYEYQVKSKADIRIYGYQDKGNFEGNRLLNLATLTSTPNLYEYSGGPHSIYGIGRTTIKRYEPITGPNSKLNRLSLLKNATPGYNAGIGSFSPYVINADEGGKTYHTKIGGEKGKLGQKTDEFDDNKQRIIWNNSAFDENGNYNVTTQNITDFRQTMLRGHTNYQKEIEPGIKIIREQRIGLGNPGKRINRGVNSKTNELIYNVYSPETVDKINALDIIRTSGDFSDQKFKDLIRFRFEAIDSDNPLEADTMVFRAFLDGLSDDYQASHNTFKYNGRGEEFYTYNSFKRKISFSFKIAAQSRHEMQPIYRKLNFLVSNVAPEYKGTRMRTPFIRLTIGSWMDRIPGVLNSVSLKWQKDYPWEIALDDEGQDKEMVVLPHILDVSVNFTPVHNFLPMKSITRSPFILPHHNNRILKPEQKWYTAGAAGVESD